MQHQHVATTCPSCSEADPLPHEVLHQGGATTVRCSDCGHVHRTTLSTEPTIDRRIIISQEDESIDARIALDPDSTVGVGDEFLVETEDAIFTARVTSIECTDGGRTESAQVSDIRTVWSRAVGNVSINLTLHPQDGRHNQTRSRKLHVPGDQRLTIGAEHTLNEETFTVERILIRDDAVAHDRRMYETEGNTVLAKDIKRVYARASGEIPTRLRGW